MIYLSEKDNSGARTVYSQYGMTYFFDILYSHYVNNYRETDLLQGPISELPLSDSPKNAGAKMCRMTGKTVELLEKQRINCSTIQTGFASRTPIFVGDVLR